MCDFAQGDTLPRERIATTTSKLISSSKGTVSEVPFGAARPRLRTAHLIGFSVAGALAVVNATTLRTPHRPQVHPCSCEAAPLGQHGC